jgi:N-acetylneuraminate synthase
MSYLDYRERLEFDAEGYTRIGEHCERRGIAWFASCWDEPSVAFIEHFAPPCHKAASACLTDLPLLRTLKSTNRPLFVSTGMSTLEEIERAVSCAGTEDLLIAHSNSTYPCPHAILNLKMISTLKAKYPYCPIGYSGHETGYGATLAAVALGATFIERHITLDKTLWGTDHKASLEPAELAELVRTIREVQSALGDGVKRRYPSELPAMRKLRRVNGG